ncbi:hypothetical protein HHI36_014954 [Cryptolaemus montrouzieri]|uniref:Ribosome biogenesis regulatory protein n=1 Tax=Cryptolaemus montrouzieri TaxID=559131 RepID=A0ABD2N5F5_9CUCU
MVLLSEILEKTEREGSKLKSITVNKHLEVDLDLGTLLAVDPNVLDKKSLDENANDYLLNLTRDNVQILFNQVWELPTERVEEAIVAKLPPSKYVLPRSKPVPKPKPLTKWQQFAKEKGIEKKKKAKLTWDEQLKKWVPRYGFKKARAEMDKNWVLEVPANADPMEDQFEKRAVAKGERIAKNELQRLRNIAKAKNVKVPRFGIVNTDKSSSKDLQTAITVAKSSTASVGKFQEKLPHEKEARGIAKITPGASSRKRKLPPVSAEHEKSFNLAIVESVLSKRPKLDIDKVVSRQIHKAQPPSEEESSGRKSKKVAGRKGQRKGGVTKNDSSGRKSKKGASRKNQKKGGGGGRKRR